MVSERRTIEMMTFHKEPHAETSLMRAGIKYGFTGKLGSTPACHYGKQIHSSFVEKAQARTAPDCHPKDRLTCDALYATEEALPIGVKTADCVPIILGDAQSKWIAAVHGGWRGLAQGIIASTLDQYKKDLVRSGHHGTTTIRAVIGPAIGPKYYEVGPEVIDAIEASWPHTDSALSLCIQKGSGDRWYIDLQVAASFWLLACGLYPAHIDIIRSCTFEEHELWYSYRRDAGMKGQIWSHVELPKQHEWDPRL